MADCKTCEGLGTMECPHCIGNSFHFLLGDYCAHCADEMLVACPECQGTGEEKEEK